MNQLHFEGVLEKHGKRFFEGFRKRWFILDGSELTYYKAQEYTEENYLGTIDMTLVRSVNPVKTVTNGFQVVTRTRTYTFSATSSELMTDWVSMLRQAMQLQSFENRRTRSSSENKDNHVGAKRKDTPVTRKDSYPDEDDLDGTYESIPNTNKAADSKKGKKSILKKSASADSSTSKPKKRTLKKSSSLESKSSSLEKLKEDPVGFYDFAKQPVNTIPTYESVGSAAAVTSKNKQGEKPKYPSDYEVADPSSTKTQPLKGSSEGLGTYEFVNSPLSRDETVAEYDVVRTVEKPSEEVQNDLYDVVSDVAATSNTATKTPSGVTVGPGEACHNPKLKPLKEKLEFEEDALYSKPKKKGKKKIPPPMVTISEDSVNDSELASPTATFIAIDHSPSEEEGAPLPPPRGTLYAIEELKMFFSQRDDEEWKVKKDVQHSSDEEVFGEQPVGAFEQLKNLLSRLETGKA